MTHHQVGVMAEGGDDVAVVGGSVVTEECLQELLDFFVKSAYRAKTVDRRVSAMNNMQSQGHGSRQDKLWCMHRP